MRNFTCLGCNVVTVVWLCSRSVPVVFGGYICLIFNGSATVVSLNCRRVVVAHTMLCAYLSTSMHTAFRLYVNLLLSSG